LKCFTDGLAVPVSWTQTTLDGGRYGIPADDVTQTNRIALWALVCAAEALNMSGVTDPYELYQHVHPSEDGMDLGGGMGGMESSVAAFRDRRDEKEVQNDVL
jgi:fatty acid synthase subunit alpha